MMQVSLNRRALLAATTSGLVVAFAGRVRAQASGPRNKMIFIIARGAMDGLSVTVPYSDPDYARHRGVLAIPAPGEAGGALALNGDFGLHPALSGLHDLHGLGQLRFAPAVALPVRIRSHFDAQDVLESGGEGVRQQTDGWLNRAILASNGLPLRGLSIGAQTPLVMRGAAPVSSWAPGNRVRSEDRIASVLQDLYVDDPLLGENLARGLATEDRIAEDQRVNGVPRAARRNGARDMGRAVARLMLDEDGADIVAISTDGWDTHAGQRAQLATRLARLDQLISSIKTELGVQWAHTVVMVSTEFGRTVRANGTSGTDHGTGSSSLVAGGALKPGGMVGDWPSLADNRLYEQRDLAPTLDIRSLFKGILRDHLGLDRSTLDNLVFPGSASEAPAVNGLI